MAETRVQLGTLLVEAGLLTRAQLADALAAQERTGLSLGRVLVEAGHVSAAAVAEALASVVTEPDGRLAELEQQLASLAAAYEATQLELRHTREELALLRQAAGEQTSPKVANSRGAGLHLAEEPAQEQTRRPAGRRQGGDPGTAGQESRPKGMRLGDLLVLKGYIDDDQLAAALLESKQTNVMLGRVLLAKGWIFEEELARCLSEQWGIEYVSLMRTGIDVAAARLLPRQVGLDAAAVPVRRRADGSVTVAFADPTDDGAIAAVQSYVPEFTPVVAELSEIAMALRSVPTYE